MSASKPGGRHEIEPAISTSRPLASRASRAAATAPALTAAKSSLWPASARTNRVVANVFVVMASAPAAMYSECI
jgi:hypothetical protein